MNFDFDSIVIGAGVVGLAVAREEEAIKNKTASLDDEVRIAKILSI